MPLTCLILLLPFILSVIITSQSLYNLKWNKLSSVAPILSSRGAQLTFFSPETRLNASLQLDSFGTIEIRRKFQYRPDSNTLEERRVWFVVD